MKKLCRDAKKIIWTKWRLLTYTTGAIRQVETKRGAKAKTGSKAGAKAASKAPRSRYHLFLREQLEEMTGEE